MSDNSNKINDKFKWVPLIIFLVAIFGGRYFVFIILGIGLYFLIKYLISQRHLREYIPGNLAGETKNMGSGIIQATKTTLLSLALVIVLVALLIASITIVDAGEVGVYSLFGKVRDGEVQSGIHLVNPLARVIKMSIRTEEYTMSKVATEGELPGDDSIPALTKEGLSVTLDITALYRLMTDKASDVYRQVGLEYETKIVRPEIRSTIREVIALYEAKDIYSEKRDEVVNKIKERLKNKFDARGLVIEDILLRDVTLPDNLAKAIQEKLQAEQEAQKYDFLLLTAKKEAERKRIEAVGQRDSQKTINESLSTNYLYYQYINTLKDRQGTIYVPTNPSTGMPQFKELGK